MHRPVPLQKTVSFRPEQDGPTVLRSGETPELTTARITSTFRGKPRNKRIALSCVAALALTEIGNEDWFDKSGSYEGRFAQFDKAIKAKYPNLQTIATMPLKRIKPSSLSESLAWGE